MDSQRPVDSLWTDTEAFHRDTGTSLEMVVLSIGESDLSLANILCSTHDLPVNAYNTVAQQFIEDVVEPARGEVGGAVEVVDESEPLAPHLDPISFEKLQLFSRAANKASSVLHPQDRERWLDFLTSAFHTNPELDAGLLKNWLIDAGWRTEMAAAFATEFSFGRRLLSRYAEEVAK